MVLVLNFTAGAYKLPEVSELRNMSLCDLHRLAFDTGYPASLITEAMESGELEPMVQLLRSLPIMTVESEDLDKAKEIGILTPREVLDTDRQVILKPAKDTWATRIHGKNAKKPLSLTDEIDFLLMQSKQEGDYHEDMLDDLADLLEHDFDRTVLDETKQFVHKADIDEFVVPQTITTVVRVTIQKHGFFIGSIAGNPGDVFIPTGLTTDPISHHSFYLMDLVSNIQGRNVWKATKIYKKLDTSAMLTSTMSLSYQDAISTIYRFKIPTDPANIGIIIGKDGRNISNLLGMNPLGSVPPNVSITPAGDSECLVNFHIPPLCGYSYEDVLNAVTYMHT